MFKALAIVLVASNTASSCFSDPEVPEPLPPTKGDCALMCEHIGPEGLDCEEGKDVYNSDLPGEEGVPNQSCEDACKEWQDNGIAVNPDCVATVPSCEEIEEYRTKDPESCTAK